MCSCLRSRVQVAGSEIVKHIQTEAGMVLSACISPRAISPRLYLQMSEYDPLLLLFAPCLLWGFHALFVGLV